MCHKDSQSNISNHLNQKHDIEVRVKSSATSAVSAGFELLVIQDTFVESRRA